MIAKTVVGLLVGVALVMLYRGMRQEQNAVDPTAPLGATKILATLHAYHFRCDDVATYQPVGKTEEGDWYVALCRDGSRYVYFQNPKKVYAMSCADASYKYGYSCPQ